MRRRRKKSDRKRGIYVLPNLITTASLFFGFYSIVSSLGGRFSLAAVAILVSVVLDGLDGRIARLTNTTSRFGVEYDSLSDLIAFGLAPALMIFLWSLEPFGRLGWLACFLYTACGALRLARFNVQFGNTNGNYFVGLPIPAAAVQLAFTVLFVGHFGLNPASFPTVILILMFALSFLMVSAVRFVSFKNLDYFRRKSFNSLVAGLLFFVVVAARPHVMGLLVSSGYVLSGPVSALRHARKKRRAERKKPVPLETKG